MAAMALGFSSCKQEDDPKYQDPTVFTVSEPAFADQVLQTNGDMTDKSTFNLFCTQPNYGYSAVCNYSALVSLNPEAPIEEWVALNNETPTQAAMSIKLYELGVAVNKLLGVADQDEFNNRDLGKKPYTCYFKAVCSIPGVAGSEIVSNNTVSYKNVALVYAEKKPAWIYVLGNVKNPVTGVENGFTAPSAANLPLYDANFRLYEPDDMVGEKIYVGQFTITPKAEGADQSNPDNASQFRFAYELLGWTSGDGFMGSNQADFYCLPISDKYEAGYTGNIVNNGLGNWGIFTTVPDDVTIVVDQLDLKIYVKKGAVNVTFTGRTPSFE